MSRRPRVPGLDSSGLFLFVPTLVPFKLVDGMNVGTTTGHHDIFMHAISDDPPPLFFDGDGHLTLRIQSSGDRVDLITDQIAFRSGQVGDGLEDGIHRPHARGPR